MHDKFFPDRAKTKMSYMRGKILRIAWLFPALCALAQEPATQALQPPPKPNVEMQKWIETVDAQWQATYAREVAAPYEEEKEKLAQKYLAGIDANATKAKTAGNLDLTLLWRDERERFAAEKTVPAEDEATAPAELKQARVTWRGQMALLDKDRAAKAKSVQGRYDQVLAQAQTQLTQRGRLEDALLVKNKREEAAAAWIATGLAAANEESRPAATSATPEASRPGIVAAKVPLGTKLGPALAKVQTQDSVLTPFAVGSPVWADRTNQFTQIAKGFEDHQFTQNKCHAGTLRFKVLSDGLVQMATTSRFLANKGSSGRESEVMTERMLQQKGWHRQRNVEFKHAEADHVWWLFTRQCKAGEEFSYRTEKYAAPILLVK